MGTLRGLVRAEAQAPREPQPSLADLDALMATTRESGCPWISRSRAATHPGGGPRVVGLQNHSGRPDQCAGARGSRADARHTGQSPRRAGPGVALDVFCGTGSGASLVAPARALRASAPGVLTTGRRCPATANRGHASPEPTITVRNSNCRHNRTVLNVHFVTSRVSGLYDRGDEPGVDSAVRQPTKRPARQR
jgi:hypothetical protein